MEKEYRLNLKIRNALLLKAIEDEGFDNPAKFAKAHGLSMQGIYNLCRLRTSLYTSDMKIRTLWAKVGEALDIDPHNLCPEANWLEPFKENSFEAEVSGEQMAKLAYMPKQESLEQTIDVSMLTDGGLMDELCNAAHANKRNRQIMRERFVEGMTLQEIGLKHNLSRDRVRQIEARGIRNLRSGENQDRLKDFLSAFD